MTESWCLKIDVDTHDGMRDGVPVLLDLLKRYGLRATFFLTLGPDRMGRAVLQLRNPRFARKMLVTGAPSLYGWRTTLSGTVLPARPVATAFPDLVKRMEAEGHEAAVHCWDHRAWQDELPRFKSHRLRLHLQRALRAYRELTGHDPAGIGAAAWMTTPDSLRAQDALPFRYASDLRSCPPCRIRTVHGEHRLPQFPGTGPCLEERLEGNRGTDVGLLADCLLAEISALSTRLRVLTLHAEVEGGAYAAAGERMFAHLRGVATPTMQEAAAAIPTQDLPLLTWGRVQMKGRGFPVSTAR
jgi:undecaprenyl phosphate-alpha-L-ara4FN deformylase